MLDAGATSGVAGDSPGIYGGMASVGWRRGGMETRGVGRSAMRWRLLGVSVATHRADVLMHALLPHRGIVSGWWRCDAMKMIGSDGEDSPRRPCMEGSSWLG